MYKRQVYRVTLGGNWGDNTWSNVSGGSANIAYFPLAQDTAIIDDSSPSAGGTVTINASFPIGTLDITNRTTAFTLDLRFTQSFVFGDFLLSSPVSLQGTIGTTVLNFAGRNNQTISLLGKQLPGDINIQSIEGTVSLSSAMEIGNNLILTAGTFDDNGYNILFANTGSGLGVTVSGSLTMGLVIDGTWTVRGSGSSFSFFGTLTNRTISGSGTISFESSTAKTINASYISMPNITIDQAGSGALTIQNPHIIKTVTNSYSSTGSTTIVISSSLSVSDTFAASGSEGNLLVLQNTNFVPLILNAAGDLFTSQYIRIINIGAYPYVSPITVDETASIYSGFNWFVPLPEPTGGGAGAFFIFMPL